MSLRQKRLSIRQALGGNAYRRVHGSAACMNFERSRFKSHRAEVATGEDFVGDVEFLARIARCRKYARWQPNCDGHAVPH